jgi:hypothetical protein
VNKITAAVALALALIIAPAVYAGAPYPAPEPGSFMMLGSGLLALAGLRAFARKRK